MVKNTKELKIIDTVNRITTTVEKLPNLKLLILLTKLEVPVFQLRVRYKKAERKRKLRQKLKKVKI